MQIPECPAPMIAMRMVGGMSCIRLRRRSLNRRMRRLRNASEPRLGLPSRARPRDYPDWLTEDGQTLYCRKDRKTGSRVQSNLTCLTEDQLVAQRRGAIDYVNNIQKGNPQMTN